MGLCYSANSRQHLPVWLTLHEEHGDNVLSFNDPFNADSLSLRRLVDLAGVLARQDALNEVAPGSVAYFMYRGVSSTEDIPLFQKAGVRYDITVIRPGSVGAECMKTFGHYHPERYAKGPTYPEVYEVLHGRAYFLLQRADRSSGGVDDVYLVEGKPGSKVVIPPGYGHVTINPGREWLITANLVCSLFDAEYVPYRQKRGAAYYLLVGEKLDFVPNPCYGHTLPSLRVVASGGLERFGIDTELNLYDAWRRNPSAFSFLVRPEGYMDQLSSFATLAKPW